MSEPARGTIFAFYSYKGGTGRTMALANVAWILASRGKRVLVIDWDVEAPGLHRYFAPFLSDPNLAETDGLLEFFERYLVSVTKALPEDALSENLWYRPYADIKRYAEPLQWQFPDSGSIDLVGAGRQSASYGPRVNAFDWDEFYRKFGGGAFLDECIRQMKAAYDYVLIDSRTGISDTSGICTIHMHDALVVFYTLNNQSIEGASNVTAHVIANRQGQSAQPFRVWSIATRVELAEKKKLETRRLFARERFSPFLQTLAGLEGQRIDDYWGEMEILYDPYYAYEEVLATIADLPGSTNSVLAAMETLAARITNGQVSRLGEMSEAKRAEALALYARRETSRAELGFERTQQPKTWDIFISASARDRNQAERLYYLLASGFKVFYAPKDIAAGEQWEKALKDALEHSRAFIVLISQESVQSEWLKTEIEAARELHERDPSFRIIPIQLDDTTTLATEGYLRRFQGLTVKDRDLVDVAVQIRKSLNISSEDDNERDRNARLKAELDAALGERQRLKAELDAALGERQRLSERLDTAIEEKAGLRSEINAAREVESRTTQKAKRLRIVLITTGVLLSLVSALAIFLEYLRHTELTATSQLISESAAGIKLGMTQAQVEQALGPELSQTRNQEGNRVLTYKYSTLGLMYVTIDSLSGKVVRIELVPPHSL